MDNKINKINAVLQIISKNKQKIFVLKFIINNLITYKEFKQSFIESFLFLHIIHSYLLFMSQYKQRG